MAYKQVEYIQTNQTYFQTSLSTGPDTKCVLDMSLIELRSGDNGIFGNTANWNTSGSFNILVHTGRLQWGFYIAGGAYDYSGNYNLDNRCIVELSSSGFSVYDTVLSSYTSEYSFARVPTQLSNGTRIGSGLYNNNMGKYRFYEVTIYSGNTIVGHYLPYKDETTGYGVLYDSVSNTYLNGYIPSAVTAGPDVSTFEVDVTEINATYNSTTCAVTLTAEEDMAWTATTVPSWVTLSSTAGTGTTQITVTVQQNKNYSARTGSVVFTSSESDTAEIAITQAKHPLLVPKNNIYRGGILVN